jgi:hypothetical protein
MAVFWVVALCSLVEVYQRFRGPCCLHHQLPDYTALQPRRQPSSAYVSAQEISTIALKGLNTILNHFHEYKYVPGKQKNNHTSMQQPINQ